MDALEESARLGIRVLIDVEDVGPLVVECLGESGDQAGTVITAHEQRDLAVDGFGIAHHRAPWVGRIFPQLPAVDQS